MKTEVVKWTELRVGQLFKSWDDAYPLRVVDLVLGGVVVLVAGREVLVFFRPGVQILRFWN
jgi:hypothetical protein